MKISVKSIGLSLFAILYITLPEYFAIELSSQIPLLTASRILIIFIFVCAFINNSGKIHIYMDRFMVVFFIIQILINLIHINSSSNEAIKSIFIIVFEQFLVIILLYNLIDNVDVFEKYLKLMVYASAVISILSIIECFTKINIFYFLKTVGRDMLQSSYERAGVRRAEGPFGHAVYLAVYNICVIPFCLQLYEKTMNSKYLMITVLNIISVIVSVSRGQIVMMVIMLIIMFMSKKGDIKVTYIKKTLWYLPLVLILLLIPQVRTFLEGTFTSIMMAFGLKSDSLMSERNVLGIQSRLGQFSGISWLLRQNAIIWGLGPNAQSRGLVYFWNDVSNNWNRVTSIDVGYLGYILWFGVVGFMSYLFFYYFLYMKIKKRRINNDVLDWNNSFRFFYISYFLCLFSTVGVSKLFYVVTALMIIYNNKLCVEYRRIK